MQYFLIKLYETFFLAFTQVQVGFFFPTLVQNVLIQDTQWIYRLTVTSSNVLIFLSNILLSMSVSTCTLYCSQIHESG